MIKKYKIAIKLQKFEKQTTIHTDNEYKVIKSIQPIHILEQDYFHKLPYITHPKEHNL